MNIKNKTIGGFAALLATSAFASVAYASPNLITNGDFELPALSGGYVNYADGSTGITGWTVVDLNAIKDEGVSLVPNSAFSSAGVVSNDGNQFIDMTGVFGQGKGLMTNIATDIGSAYRLRFALGEFWVASFGSFGAAAVDLAIDGVWKTSSLNPVSLSAPGSDWQMQTYDFVASTASTSIQITNMIGPSFSDAGTGLDSVTLELVSVAPVPEPSTIALMIGGLTAIGMMLRRRRA